MNKLFEQFWLGMGFSKKQEGGEEEGFTTSPGSENPVRDRVKLMELINSFTISPNVIQTAKSLIVGSGSTSITLNAANAVITAGGLDLTDVPISPNTGLRDGIIYFQDNLYVQSLTGASASTYIQIAKDDTFIMRAPGGMYVNTTPLVEFDISGGLSSTYVQVTRRNNVPVIAFPNFESPPATCTINDLCTASGKLYICTAPNTWTVVGTQT